MSKKTIASAHKTPLKRCCFYWSLLVKLSLSKFMSCTQLKMTQQALLGVSCVCQQLDTMKGGRKLSSQYMESARQRKISAPAGSLNRKIRSVY